MELGDILRKINGVITGRPTNFSWLLNDIISGSGFPTSAKEIRWLKDRGVKSILSLTENDVDDKEFQGTCMDHLHLPIPNHYAPSFEQLLRAINFIKESLEKNKPVLIHCAAGLGRTGTVLAAYLVESEKLNANEAIERVRAKRPGSIEECQEESIQVFAKHLNN